MKTKFGIVLIKPQLGENIGACARSMKNFGLNNLKIVLPKFSFPNHKTKARLLGYLGSTACPQSGATHSFRKKKRRE